MADNAELELLRLRARAKSKASQAREVAPEPTPEPSFGAKAAHVLHEAMKPFGWAGGMTRNMIAQRADLMSKLGEKLGADPRPELTREGDTIRALHGEAPSGKDYLGRMGVDLKGQLSDVVPGFAEPGQGTIIQPEKGGMFDLSKQGAAGAAIDIGTDPLTYLAGPLSALAKAGKLGRMGKATNALVNPVETAAREGATTAYQGAFKNIDEAVSKIQKSPETVAKMAQEAGFVGNPQQAADFVESLNARAGEEIGNIYNEATNKGAQVDLGSAYNKALQKADELRSTGNLENQKVADLIEKRVNTYRESLPYNQTVSDANVIKSDLNSRSKFKLTGEDSVNSQSMKEVSTPLKQDIDAAVGQTDPELLKNLLEKNNRYRSTNEDVQYIADSWAGREPQLRNPLTPTKVDLLAMAAKPGAGITKKIGDIVLSTRGRTATGRGLDLLGKKSSSITDTVNREMWLEMLREKQNEEK